MDWAKGRPGCEEGAWQLFWKRMEEIDVLFFCVCVRKNELL